MIINNGQQQIGSLPVVSSIGRTSTTVSTVGRTSTASAAPITGQVSMCAAAVNAASRQSPAAPNLAAQCAQMRRDNVMKRVYLPDAMTPNDPAYRVALTDAGEAVIALDLQLQLQRSKLANAELQRGFTMAQGMRSGNVDPGFVAFVAPGLPGDLLRGLTDALAQPAAGGGDLTQLTRDGKDGLVPEKEEGVPTAVLIGAGVIGVGVLGLLAYKMTR